MKLWGHTCANDCHENVRRIETNIPHELDTKPCTRKEQKNNWNIYETISSQQVFSRATLLYPMDRKSIFIRKNFGINCTCFLIHIRHKLCACGLLIWHNITYRPISWSVKQQDSCEKTWGNIYVFFTGIQGWVNMNPEVPMPAIQSRVFIILPIFQERLRWFPNSELTLCTRQTVFGCKLIKMKPVAEEETKLSFRIRYKIYESLKIPDYCLPGNRSVTSTGIIWSPLWLCVLKCRLRLFRLIQSLSQESGNLVIGNFVVVRVKQQMARQHLNNLFWLARVLKLHTMS